MPSISGLSSGLDTTTIISQLMALERIPQSRLRTQQTAAESAIGSLRTLNTKFSSMLGVAEGLGARLPGAVVPTPAPPSPWTLTKASSSDATRTSASAVAGAPSGSLSFHVRQLATAASHISNGYAGTGAAVSDAGGTAHTSFTLVKGADANGENGVSTTITTANGTLAETVAALNAAKAGVTASLVQVTPAQGGTPASYRMQLTSTTTGANTGLSLKAEGGNEILATQTVVPKNAEIDLGGVDAVGNPLNIVSRASNTLSDVMEGVTLTLTKADTARTGGGYEQPPVTVSVTKDVDGIAGKVQALVDAANAARADVTSLTAVDPVSKAKGRLYGESSIRGLADQIRSAVPGNVVDTSTAGIAVDRNGLISFDRAKFLTALAGDPTAVEKALGKDGLAGRLHTLADQVSRGAAAVGGPGLITNAITGKESRVSTLTSGIATWDNRLAMKEKQLNRTYTSLETALGKAQSQGQWLAGQLAALPTSGR